MTDNLRHDVQFLKGVGPTKARLLLKLGISTIGDLLFHFPRSYDDLGDVRPITSLAPGELQTVHGEVVEINGKRLPDGRSIVEVVIADESGNVIAGTWFNQAYAAKDYHYGQRLAFSGKPKWFRDHWQMNTPRVQAFEEVTEKESRIVPVYPLTDGLRPEQMRSMLETAVSEYAGELPEILPQSIRARRQLPEATQAMRDIHFPETLPAAHAARRRFAFEELLVLQLALAARRRELRDRQQAPKVVVTKTIDARIRQLYPFELTNDQGRAIGAICRDIGSDRPMQRLLQADVGAGKTAVAVYALLATVANKYQAVLMAPTEVLARQHWHTLDRYLEKSRVRRVLLTGSLSNKERQQTLEEIRLGQLDLIIGTQALIQKDVHFASLGLVVIDEQHKFGVAQRARMRRLGIDPHYLVMTATPIPRTVALTLFGDLDVSTIRQLPPGRKPVRTSWVQESKRERTYGHIRSLLEEGRQAYFVYPLVEESDVLDLRSAEQMHTELSEGPFSNFRIGLLHGRMDENKKNEIMTRFRNRELDLLVSTVVIEVGVDVPNATVMVIEHAGRFGLSQLHQLRGRISRGEVPGECYLFTGPVNDESRERLRAFTRIRDGFALAEEDARQRGLGEFFGMRQHGLGELRVADLHRDREILLEARDDAIDLVSNDAGLHQPEHAPLKRTVLERYGRTLDLAEIG